MKTKMCRVFQCRKKKMFPVKYHVLLEVSYDEILNYIG